VRPENQLDAVIHLGAGYCREIDAHLASGAARIILVEANPEIAAELRLQCAAAPRIAVIEAAVAAKSGPAKLSVYNYASVSSLHTSETLFSLYPGLRLVREIGVNAIAADEFLKNLSLNSNDANHLVIDTPGEQGAIIDVLSSAGLLALFNVVTVQCEAKTPYNGAKNAPAVKKALEKSGFDIDGEGDDPDRPRYVARRDPTFAAQQTVASLEEQHRETIALLEEKDQERAYRQSLVDEEVHRLEAQIELIKDILIREKLV
jgi:FkbM family methyltransferase